MHNLGITEQPDFAFGQSWPNLVYLPISAYTDSTQRWMLFGHINTKFTGFVQEVTPQLRINGGVTRWGGLLTTISGFQRGLLNSRLPCSCNKPSARIGKRITSNFGIAYTIALSRKTILASHRTMLDLSGWDYV